MKKAQGLLFALILLAAPFTASAHPGNTDSSGCHTCRTNCPKWGLSTGEYHCHRSKGVPQPLEPIRSHVDGTTELWPDYKNPSTGTKTTPTPTVTIPQTSSVPTSATVITYGLAKGMENTQVTRLQQLLAKDKSVYPEGLVTGYFGPATERAVKAFQKKHGLEQVGYVGPRTRALLNAMQ